MTDQFTWYIGSQLHYSIAKTRRMANCVLDHCCSLLGRLRRLHSFFKSRTTGMGSDQSQRIIRRVQIIERDHLTTLSELSSMSCFYKNSFMFLSAPSTFFLIYNSGCLDLIRYKAPSVKFQSISHLNFYPSTFFSIFSLILLCVQSLFSFYKYLLF